MPDPDRHHIPDEAQVLAVIAGRRRVAAGLGGLWSKGHTPRDMAKAA
jgi:hypothetical protein